MLPKYVHVSAKFSIPASLFLILDEHIRGRIMRERYIEGRVYGVLIMISLVKDRGREAGPASFVVKLFTSTYLLNVGTCR